MEWLRRDLRYAVRRLTRSPGYTLVAVLTLALGIGATTAIFSAVNGVLFSPLPFPEPDRLAALIRPADTQADMSIPDGRDLRQEVSTLHEVGLFIPFWAFDLTGTGDPERLRGSLVEPEYFEILGMAPMLGRALTPDDNRPGGARVAVISESLWRSRFGADPNVIGRALRLSGRPYTIVGVMPAEFDVFDAGTELWAPVAVEVPEMLEQRGTNNFEAIARLAPGATYRSARSDVEALTRRLAEIYPRTNRAKILGPVPLRELVVGDVKPALLVLLGAVGLVLLIACVNLANLALVRGSRREHEFAVRRALGGDAVDLMRQQLTESVLVAMVGGALGTLLAVQGTEVLVGLAPIELPRADAVGASPWVLGFAFLITLLAGVGVGLLPALAAARADHNELLRSGTSRLSSGRRRNRSLTALVVSQVALAFVLLVGTGLLVRTFLSLQQVELGFEPDGVLAANLVLPESRYSEMAAQTRAFIDMVSYLEARPGVERAGFVIGAPLGGIGGIGNNVLFADRPVPDPAEQPSAANRPVLGDYFRTMGITVLRGRGIEPTDDAEAPPVAVVNETFAGQFWPNENPIGKRVAWRPAGDESPPRWMTVVGVASDVSSISLRTGDPQTLYTSYLQRQQPWQRFGTLVARVRRAPSSQRAVMREAVWSVDDRVPVENVTPVREWVDRSTARERFSSLALGVFAAVALLIALQGLYGVLSYAVAQRRREIGIRMAIGARAADVVRLIVGRGVTLAAMGLGLGVVGALAGARLLSSLLFGVQSTDVAVYAAVALLLLVTAVVAAYLPARRAATLDPARTLRQE